MGCGVGEDPESGALQIYGLPEQLNSLKKHGALSGLPKSLVSYVNSTPGAIPSSTSEAPPAEKTERVSGGASAAANPAPSTESLPVLPQVVLRIVFCDPEGIIVWNDRGQLIGSSI